MSTRRISGRWVIVTRDLRLGPIPLGHVVRLEDGPIFRAPILASGLYEILGEKVRSLLGWWRPTLNKAITKGYAEARS